MGWSIGAERVGGGFLVDEEEEHDQRSKGKCDIGNIHNFQVLNL